MLRHSIMVQMIFIIKMILNSVNPFSLKYFLYKLSRARAVIHNVDAAIVMLHEEVLSAPLSNVHSMLIFILYM